MISRGGSLFSRSNTTRPSSSTAVGSPKRSAIASAASMAMMKSSIRKSLFGICYLLHAIFADGQTLSISFGTVVFVVPKASVLCAMHFDLAAFV
jgi:hypothetical protein